MADKDSVEKYLENNPQFAKEYFEKNIRCEAIAAAFGEKLDIKDPTSFKDVSQIQEAKIIFDMISEMHSQPVMEKAIHKVLQRICMLVNADRCSYFIHRARNGIPELATCLFDVTPTSKYEANLVNPQSEIVFPTDMGIIGQIATTKKPVNVPDVKQVSKSSKGVFPLVILFLNLYYILQITNKCVQHKHNKSKQHTLKEKKSIYFKKQILTTKL